MVADDEWVGRAAGSACALAKSNDVVDAIVVMTALKREALVVSSDKVDLEALASAIGAELTVFAT